MTDPNAPTAVVNGMDQSNFEDAVSAAIEKRLGIPATVFESANYGVVAIARLDGIDLRKVDWQEVAAELARETGVGVTCMANCDWTFDDQPDEEATFIAFACAPESYRDDPYRNLISAVDPATAPSETDFSNLRRARNIVKGHLDELRGRRETLIAAMKDEGDVVGRIHAIEKLKDLGAGDREAVAAVIALDFDAAVAAVADAEPASPRM